MLKKGAQAVKDARKKSDGSPLRLAQDLPSIATLDSSSTTPYEIERLYQTQLSFVVTGINHWIWVAYVFVDVVECEDTVNHYDREAKDLGVPSDPLACGRIPIEAKYIPPPKLYFLKVFRIRIKKIKYEWHYIVRRLQRDVKK